MRIAGGLIRFVLVLLIFSFLMTVAGLCGRTAYVFLYDQWDSATGTERLEKVLAPRIEAHQEDLDLKNKKLWDADPGRAMVANR